MNKSVENKPLKIVLYVNSFLPNIGGKEFVVYYLAKALQELGHDVRIVGPSAWWKNRSYKFPFPVHRYPYFGTGRLNKKFAKFNWVTKCYEAIRLWALSINIKKFGCDIIHAHNTYPNGYVAACLYEKTNIPLIITPHGEDIQIIPELEFGLRLNPKLNTRINHSLTNAYALTAISENVYKALLDANAEKEKINMIPNGVDLERFSKHNELDVRQCLGFPENSKLVVTVGQFHPRKGHDILIRAIHSILEHVPSVRLAVIGNSDSSLEKLVDELDLRGVVKLTGPIKSPSLTNADQQSSKDAKQEDLLAAILQNSECYVSAGIGEDSEGLSLAVLEAMAASIPIVASDISGNRDVVIDGENGFLVAPGNVEELGQAILKFLVNKPMQKEMGMKAKNTAEKFGWLEIAKQYESLYRKVHHEYK